MTVTFNTVSVCWLCSMLSHVQCWVITILLYLHSIAFQVVLWVLLLLRWLRLYLPSIWWSYNALALFKLAPPWPATEFQCISTQLWEYYWHWRLWLRGQHLVIGIITGSIPVVCMSECPCARYGQRRLQNALNVNVNDTSPLPLVTVAWSANLNKGKRGVAGPV